MKPCLRLAAFLTLVAALSPALGAQTVIDQLYGQRHYDLADAYWAAGQRFIDLGQADRGAEFQARAKALFPGYVPGQAPAAVAASLTAPPAPEPQVPAASAVREQSLQADKIARLQFQKLLRGYLTGNASALAAALGPSVKVQGQDTPVDGPALAAFLTAHPADAGTPDDLFRTETLETAPGDGAQVVLSVAANPDAGALASLLPFWKDHQRYTFDRVGDTWKLVAVEGR